MLSILAAAILATPCPCDRPKPRPRPPIVVTHRDTLRDTLYLRPVVVDHGKPTPSCHTIGWLYAAGALAVGFVAYQLGKGDGKRVVLQAPPARDDDDDRHHGKH
jgi:hypothetical protein